MTSYLFEAKTENLKKKIRNENENENENKKECVPALQNLFKKNDKLLLFIYFHTLHSIFHFF